MCAPMGVQRGNNIILICLFDQALTKKDRFALCPGLRTGYNQCSFVNMHYYPDEKPKEIAILKDPRLHRDLQSSTTALSAIASGIAGLSPRDGSDTAATTSDARRGDEEKGIPVIYPSLNEEGNDGLPLTGTVKTYSSPMAADDDTSQFIAQGTNIPPSSASLDSSRPSREDTYEIGSRAPNLPVAEQGTMRS